MFFDSYYDIMKYSMMWRNMPLCLRFEKVMDEREAYQMNVLRLAYLGDSVWETIIRYHMILKKLNVHHLHEQSVKRVNAAAQAEMLSRISGSLSENEAEIVRRGRNAHPKHTVPRNQQPENYAASTGFEALFGYLYLTGQNDRIRELYQIIMEQESQNG